MDAINILVEDLEIEILEVIRINSEDWFKDPEQKSGALLSLDTSWKQYSVLYLMKPKDENKKILHTRNEWNI